MDLIEAAEKTLDEIDGKLEGLRRAKSRMDEAIYWANHLDKSGITRIDYDFVSRSDSTVGPFEYLVTLGAKPDLGTLSDGTQVHIVEATVCGVHVTVRRRVKASAT